MVTVRHANGEPVHLEVNGTPITADCEVVGVQGVGRDVMLRKERERELRMKTQVIDDVDVGINWIVTRYGGSFRIRAGDADGSIATVRLPAIDADAPVEAAARPPTVLFR